MIDTAAIQRKDRRDGLIVSLILHGMLAILFLFIGLKQWDPPLAEQMIEVAMADFGNNADGAGTVETPNPGAQQQTSPPVVEDPPEEVATDNKSEVEVVKPKEKPKEKDKPKVPTVSSALQNALNQWNKGGGSEGETQGDQNQGTSEGDPNGSGTIHGNGWSVSLGGRGLGRGPSITDKPDEAGKVVLNIWVDRAGKVQRVTQNLDKSTTTSQALFTIAKKAALQCTFTAKPDAAAEQKGEMTFVFILE